MIINKVLPFKLTSSIQNPLRNLLDFSVCTVFTSSGPRVGINEKYSGIKLDNKHSL